MPCQSYDSSWDRGSDDRKIRALKAQADKLARIACKALTTLQENELEDLLLLKDDEVREWWLKHQEDDRKAQEARNEKERREQMRQEALAKLSLEEREVLGISSGKKTRRTGDGFDISQMLENLNSNLSKPRKSRSLKHVIEEDEEE